VGLLLVDRLTLGVIDALELADRDVVQLVVALSLMLDDWLPVGLMEVVLEMLALALTLPLPLVLSVALGEADAEELVLRLAVIDTLVVVLVDGELLWLVERVLLDVVEAVGESSSEALRDAVALVDVVTEMLALTDGEMDPVADIVALLLEVRLMVLLGLSDTELDVVLLSLSLGDRLRDTVADTL
jgi:hypothetical protein